MNWNKSKPTEAGAYWVRGYEIGCPETKALVEVRGEGDCLLCNLHEVNTSNIIEDWYSLDLLDDDFEWYGPLK